MKNGQDSKLLRKQVVKDNFLKSIKHDKEYVLMIKAKMHNKDITLRNIYLPSNTATAVIKQKGKETDFKTVIIRDLRNQSRYKKDQVV